MVWRKMSTFPITTCIREHPAFNACCLDKYMLEKNYNRNKRRFPNAIPGGLSQPKKYKRTAEGEYLDWLNPDNQNRDATLPSCVKEAFDGKFPDSTVRDASWPVLQ
uniref:P2X purinoceptor 7-like n=1 Tax=Phallusia mammillata TaxID=59560 RepID=A0A6F9DNZ1_9ASCI|nr:P2X purinoceptor 7-like [Phallusia mammillata]